DDVPPPPRLYRPACPKRTSYPHAVAHSPAHQRMSSLPHSKHRVDQAVVQRWVATDGDWQLAYSEHPQHAELSGLEQASVDFVLGLERQGKCVRRLLGHLSYRVRLGKHRVGCDCRRHDHHLTAYTSSNCRRVASSLCSMIWAK